MNPEVEDRIARIETRLNEIDAEILTLQEARDALLTEDEEYAGYLDMYQAFYNDEPLTIRRYYELSEELERINEQFLGVPIETLDDVWRVNKNRLAYLERMLAA